MNLWVELQKEFLGKPAGEKIKLSTEAEKKSLLESGIAKECESPESDVITKAAESLVTKTLDAVGPVVDAKIKSFSNSLQKQFDAEKVKGAQLFVEPKNDDDFDPTFSFKSLSDFQRWVMDYHRPGGSTESAKNKAVHYKEAVQKAPSGMFEMSDPDGGALVPPEFVNTIWSRVQQTVDIMGKTSSFTVSGNSVTIPADAESSRVTGSRRGGVQAYWTGEADQYTGSRPKFRKMTLQLNKLIVLTYATEELISDSASALESYLTRVAAEEISFKIGDAFFNGTGAGMPLGVLKADALVSVAKETGQAANTIVYENILKMWSRCYGQSRINAAWYINQDVEPQLNSMSQAIGTGGVTVYLPPGGLSQSPYGTLLGRPVIPTEFNPTLGTVGDIVLADFSQYASATKGGGIKSAASMHLRFDYDEVAFKWSFRMDAQPFWQSALTPAKGTNTQSPFVALATRA